MKYVFMILASAALIALLVYSLPARADEVSLDVIGIQNASLPRQRSSNITGPTRGLDRNLVRRLNRMARHFGTDVNITSHGGCRLHGSRRAPNSKHKISNGCIAADVTMRGVSKVAILRYWRDHGGGGRGYYCSTRRRNRPFVHVDDRLNSERWAWFCGRNTSRYLI